LADFVVWLIFSPITTHLLLLCSNFSTDDISSGVVALSIDSAEQFIDFAEFHVDKSADDPQFLTISILKHLNSIQ